MFLLLCLILCAIMAMAAFALWILDALSLIYPSISPSSSSGSSSISPSSSCVQLNVGPIVLPTVLDQQQLSSAETALTCDSGLPSYEETMNPRWTEGTLDCHLNQNLCRWEPVGFELSHNKNSYFHWKLFSSLCTWSYTQQRHWLQTFDPCQGFAMFCQGFGHRIIVIDHILYSGYYVYFCMNLWNPYTLTAL